MITPEVQQYIQTQRSAGVPDFQIQQALVARGWSSQDISEAMETRTQNQNLANTFPVSQEKTFVINGWSWGAFNLPLLWGIRFKVWSALLVFIPLVNVIWVFVLGLKGREWAWSKRGDGTEEEFDASLRRWDRWGLATFILGLTLTAVYYFFLPNNFLTFLSNAKPSENLQQETGQLPSGWSIYTSPDGSFSVAFPQEPKVKNSDAKTYYTAASNTQVFGLTEEIVSAKIPNIKEFLNSAAQLTTTIIPGSMVISNTYITYQANPANDFTIQNTEKQKTLRGRIIFVSSKKRLLLLLVEGPLNTFNENDSRSFLNSLDITK